MYEYICNKLLPAVDETKVKVDSFFRESFYASSITPLSRIVTLDSSHACVYINSTPIPNEKLGQSEYREQLENS
jgi:hypothetical protein